MIKAFLDAGLYTIEDRCHRVRANDNGNIPWATVLADHLEVLKYFKNDPHFYNLGVEIINECSNTDVYPQAQIVVNGIRNAGFTNPIHFCDQPGPVVKRLVNPPGTSGETHQGIHHYEDETKNWQNQIDTLNRLGCTELINTEQGAGTTTSLYTAANIAALNAHIVWNDAHGVGTMIWTDSDLQTLPFYNNNLVFTGPSAPPMTHNLSLQSTPIVTWNVDGASKAQGTYPYNEGTTVNLSVPNKVII